MGPIDDMLLDLAMLNIVAGLIFAISETFKTQLKSN